MMVLATKPMRTTALEASDARGSAADGETRQGSDPSPPPSSQQGSAQKNPGIATWLPHPAHHTIAACKPPGLGCLQPHCLFKITRCASCMAWLASSSPSPKAADKTCFPAVLEICDSFGTPPREARHRHRYRLEVSNFCVVDPQTRRFRMMLRSWSWMVVVALFGGNCQASQKHIGNNRGEENPLLVA